MRRILMLLFMMIPLFSFADEDDVETIYLKVTPKEKVLALSNSGLIRRDVSILMETTLDPGVYEVELTLVDDCIYHIEGTDYYLDMPMCLEIAIMDDAILKVSEYGGYSFAKVIWED